MGEVSRIYWDTMIYAYWFEDHPSYGDRIQEIRSMMKHRGDTLCGSLFLLGELLVGPVKLKNWSAVAAIQEFFDSPSITLLPYSHEAALTFASLRAEQGVKRWMRCTYPSPLIPK